MRSAGVGDRDEVAASGDDQVRDEPADEPVLKLTAHLQGLDEVDEWTGASPSRMPRDSPGMYPKNWTRSSEFEAK